MYLCIVLNGLRARVQLKSNGWLARPGVIPWLSLTLAGENHFVPAGWHRQAVTASASGTRPSPPGFLSGGCNGRLSPTSASGTKPSPPPDGRRMGGEEKARVHGVVQHRRRPVE